jgi:hypothetical protein
MYKESHIVAVEVTKIVTNQKRKLVCIPKPLQSARFRATRVFQFKARQ